MVGRPDREQPLHDREPRHPRSSETGALALLVLFLAPSASAATTVVVGSDPSKTVIKGTLLTPEPKASVAIRSR